MGSDAHGQDLATPGTESLGGSRGRLHCSPLAADDDLAGRVAVGDGDDALGRADRDELFVLIVGQADDRGHGTIAGGGLHQLAAHPHQAYGISQVQHAGRDHGAVLTHGVAGEVAGRAVGGGLTAKRGLQCALGRDGRGQQGRLGVDGEVELLCWAFPGQLRDGVPEGLVGFLPDGNGLR